MYVPVIDAAYLMALFLGATFWRTLRGVASGLSLASRGVSNVRALVKNIFQL